MFASSNDCRTAAHCGCLKITRMDLSRARSHGSHFVSADASSHRPDVPGERKRIESEGAVRIRAARNSEACFARILGVSLSVYAAIFGAPRQWCKQVAFGELCCPARRPAAKPIAPFCELGTLLFCVRARDLRVCPCRADSVTSSTRLAPTHGTQMNTVPEYIESAPDQSELQTLRSSLRLRW